MSSSSPQAISQSDSNFSHSHDVGDENISGSSRTEASASKSTPQLVKSTTTEDNRKPSLSQQQAQLNKGDNNGSNLDDNSTGTNSSGGVFHKKMTRDEMMRIQSQWQSEEHQDMLGLTSSYPTSDCLEPVDDKQLGRRYSEKKKRTFIRKQRRKRQEQEDQEELSHPIGGMIAHVGQWWQRVKERQQQENLMRQVEEQNVILKNEAIRLRNQQRLESMKHEIFRQQLYEGTMSADATDAAPEHYMQQANTRKNMFQPVVNPDIADVSDLQISDPAPSSTSGIGMSVTFDMATAANSSIKSNSIDDQSKSREEEDEDEDGDEGTLYVAEIKIVPEQPHTLKSSPHILTQSMMKKIAERAFPASLLFAYWKRVYSLCRDGDSFETMLRLCSKNDKTLLVIKTTTGDILGGFADNTWEIQHFHRQGGGFYGGGQAVLFSIVGGADDSGEEEENVVAYRWTGANRYIQLCDGDKKMLAMGGGGKEGTFGLCVQDDFRIGSTGRCDTFNNLPLISQSGTSGAQDHVYFDILDVEVWGFVSGIF